MKQICWMTLGGLLLSVSAAAQNNAAQEQALERAKQAMDSAMASSPIIGKIVGPENMVLTAPVTGAPYSAEEVTTFTQTLGDGTHIQREDKVTVYRDSQGRTRRETPTEITITDPEAGVAYSLNPAKLTARKMMVMMKNAPEKNAEDKLAAALRSRSATVTTDGGPGTYVFVSGQTESKSSANAQSLGTQSFEGVLAEGTGATETIEAGAIGNDRPFQVVDERWYSPELKTMTMTRHSDPRTGEQVFRLTNIRRGEPSPDLFQFPAGYQVVGAGAARQ
jgi:hypothetical protein